MSQGVLYVGVDRPYFEQSLESLESLRESNDVPASIVTSPELADAKGADLFDSVITVEDSFGDVRDKVYNFSASPYDKTLFLDGDTTVIGDISDVFELLERVDIAAVASPSQYTIDIPDVPNCFPKMNTGVVAFRDTVAVDEMFELWAELVERQRETGRPRSDESLANDEYETLADLANFGNVYDEPPFREAVYRSDVSWSMLPPEYNFGKPGRGHTQREVKVLHSAYREKLRGVINDTDVPRTIAGKKLYFEHRHHAESVRLQGIPVVEPVVHYLRLPTVAKRLGVYGSLQRLYQSLAR